VDVSSPVMDLEPVTFNYISDEAKTEQFGLIAEEVEEIMPELVIYNKEGQPESVMYHVLPTLLLNELKKAIGRLNVADSRLNIAELEIESLKQRITEFETT